MLLLAHLLERVPLPPVGVPPQGAASAPAPVADPAGRSGAEPTRPEGRLLHHLAADLPEGHLQVWSGPHGGGKTRLLLTLLRAAAERGRRVAYATYDLAPESLALRLLSMCSGVELARLPDPGDARGIPPAGGPFTPEEAQRARAARDRLCALPFSFLAARGLGVDSLRDRLVRQPFRPSVLAVDYLQAVVRPPGSDSGVALRQLSELAAGLHVAVLCAARAPATDVAALIRPGSAGGAAARVDRLGCIAPAAGPGSLRAAVIENRYGPCPALDLIADAGCGRLDEVPGPRSGAPSEPGTSAGAPEGPRTSAAARERARAAP